MYDIDYTEGPWAYAEKMDKVNADRKAVMDKYQIKVSYRNNNTEKYYDLILNNKCVTIAFQTTNYGISWDFWYVAIHGCRADTTKLKQLETWRNGDLGDYYALEPTIKAIQLYIERGF